MTCVFQTFVQSTFTCTINLLQPCMFQSSNDTGYSAGLKHSMNSIIKLEEYLNYSDKFMPLLIQNRTFENSSIPQTD